MNILLNRVDERLIHGQILSAWVRKYGVELLVVLDDNLAEDPFTQSVFTMAMPKKIDVLFLSVQSGVQWFESHPAENRRVMVLFRNLFNFKRAFNLGYAAKTLNIGSMLAGPQRRKLNRDVFATEEEIRIMKRLLAAGVTIHIQVVGTETRTDVAELLENLR